MPGEPPSELKFEIGHVLFIDIVGYSKLLITEQSEQIQRLKEIVRATEQFRIATAEGKLLRLPTGDGSALVFRTTPEAPVLCALEISKALKNHPELHVRMGIHSGPVNEITDLNEQANIAGAGINIAQRVMDCGDAGHILLTKRVAEDLEQYPRWRSSLHELGECEVKHGVRVGVVNLYADEVGNPRRPQRFQALKRRRARVRWAEMAVALLVLAAIVAGLVFFLRRPTRSVLAISEKSIAVMPFENLSADPNNAYFAEGIQDEILTRLSKIADLKVISRTSTQHYKSAPDNLREIAKQLEVAYILEGSVQKSDDSVRVNVQLIKAANDSHLWADTFDRKLTDIFSVESEIATKIADSLQAKLTGSEQRAIAMRPTENSEAHDLYLRGMYYARKYTPEAVSKAKEYFTQAIALDPNYALAYDGLAYLYYGADWSQPPSVARQKGRELATKALEINPDLAEAHTSLGVIHMWYEYDWPGAEAEFKHALELNPNSSNAHQWYGLLLLYLGRFDKSFAEGKRAVARDPLSPEANTSLGIFLFCARRYDEALQQLRTTLELEPNYWLAQEYLGLCLLQKGDVSAAIATLEKATQMDGAAPEVWGSLGYAYAVAKRPQEARKMISELERKPGYGYVFPYSFAVIYAGLGEKDKSFEYLDKEYKDGSYNLGYLKTDPQLDSLRSDPRFAELIRRLKLGP